MHWQHETEVASLLCLDLEAQVGAYHTGWPHLTVSVSQFDHPVVAPHSHSLLEEVTASDCTEGHRKTDLGKDVVENRSG